MPSPSTNSCEKETKKKIEDAYNLAKDLWSEGNGVKALEITDKTISDHGKKECCNVHHELQGHILYQLAEETEITNDIRRLYLFASLDAFSMSQGQSTDEMMKKLDDDLIHVVSTEDESVTSVVVADTRTSTCFNRLKNIWDKLDDKTKSDFLVVEFEQLLGYIQDKHGMEVKEHFQKCVPATMAMANQRCWMCLVCSQVNYSFTDCKMHILDSHVQRYEPGDFSARPKYVDGVLADMISYGDWKPLDAATATNLIMDRIKRGEVFVYVNGWCSDWPVAEDEERENTLKQFAELLKSSCHKDNPTLSCTLWEWLIDYTEEHLDLPGVPGCYLDMCSFYENPQCICFLDRKHLEHILKYFRQLTTDVRASLVSKVVNKLWGNSQVKESIDLELDKIGTGDRMVSWILDCQEIDPEFVSQMAKGLHNREILWFAVLSIVRCMDRKKESYYVKRHKMLTYDKMLGEVETICGREDKRKNANQRSTYESALLEECENQLVVKQDDDDDDDTKCFFLTVVRDVFEGQNSPRFEALENME
ncbi:hypothetical protein CARUB_v10025631mg, partial [Capsella rubella]